MYVSPQDAFSYFTVKQTAVQLAGVKREQVVKQDTRRILLSFHTPVIGNRFWLSLTEDYPLQEGHTVDGSRDPLTWRNSLDAILTQSAWYAYPSVGATYLDVIEVLLNKEPCARSDDK